MLKDKTIYALLLVSAINCTSLLNAGIFSANAETGLDLGKSVTELEQAVLNKTFLTDPLPTRVERLETAIIPKDRFAWENKPLPDRVYHLVSIIPIPSTLKYIPSLTSQPSTIVQSPEERRFEQAKQQRRKDMALVYIGYITSVTQNVARTWQGLRSPAHGFRSALRFSLVVVPEGEHTPPGWGCQPMVRPIRSRPASTR